MQNKSKIVNQISNIDKIPNVDKISIVDEIPTKFRQNTIIFFNCRLPYIEKDEARNSCRKRRTWEAILN